MNAIHFYFAASLIIFAACGAEPTDKLDSSREIPRREELPRGTANVTVNFPAPETCSCYNVSVEWNQWCAGEYAPSSVELANCYAEGEADFETCKPANYPSCLFAYWPEPE